MKLHVAVVALVGLVACGGNVSTSVTVTDEPAGDAFATFTGANLGMLEGSVKAPNG